MLFLVAGFMAGSRTIGIAHVGADSSLLHWSTEIGLYSVLFVDGMHAPRADLREGWRGPLRLLAIAMPLTVVLALVAARLILGMGWLEAALLAAVLAPTDPLLAEAIIGRESVPWRVRHTLNVESGLNDGLALPLVLILLTVLGSDHGGVAPVTIHLVEGVAIGIAVPFAMVRLERFDLLGASERYRTLGIVAIALLVYASGAALDANLFLAAFVAGITVATMAPNAPVLFDPIGRTATELMKLGAAFLVGALISGLDLLPAHWAPYVFAVVLFLVVRPVAVMASLVRSTWPGQERMAIAWFGPKGFASILYSLLVLRSGIATGSEVFQVAAIAIAVSIVVHSSTDVVIARRFRASTARPASAGTFSPDPSGVEASGAPTQRPRGAVR